jgi:hypothetical protein
MTDGCDLPEGVSANPLLADLMAGLKEGEKKMLKISTKNLMRR